MQVWNVLHAACCKYRTQKLGKKLPSEHHHTTLSSCIFATKACIDNWKNNLLNSNIFWTRSHNMVNVGTAEIDLGVWGTPANFNEFHILAALLPRCRAMEVNQTLHDVWPSPEPVHYIYIFGGSWPLTEFCQVLTSLCIQVLRYHIMAALLHGTRAVGASQTLWHGILAAIPFNIALSNSLVVICSNVYSVVCYTL